jgi:hypothetical protein
VRREIAGPGEGPRQLSEPESFSVGPSSTEVLAGRQGVIGNPKVCADGPGGNSKGQATEGASSGGTLGE